MANFGPGLSGYLIVDPIVGGVLTVDIGHFKTHNSVHYFISDHVTIGDGGTALITVAVPASKFPHFSLSISSTDVLTTDIYENVTAISGGTAITAFNNKRNSANESALTVKINPTATLGDRLGGFKWGASGVGTRPGVGGEVIAGDRENELLLKDGTNYAWQFVSGAAGNVVTYRAGWYE